MTSAVYPVALTSRSEALERVYNPVGYPLIIGMFRRGVVGQVMQIHHGNINAVLGYEPNNPYFQLVLDFLDHVSVVNVLRVVLYDYSFEHLYSDVFPEVVERFESVYSATFPTYQFEHLYSRVLSEFDYHFEHLYSEILPERERSFVYLSSLCYPFELGDEMTVAYQVLDGKFLGIAGQDALNVSYAVLDGVLKDTLLKHNQPQDDALSVSYAVLDGVLKDTLLKHNQPHDDVLAVNYQVLDGELK